MTEGKMPSRMLILLLLVLVEVALGQHPRGPHHPRGERVKHVHYKPNKNKPEQKITENVELLHDKEHLQDHLDYEPNQVDLSKLTDEELEFYYFTLHDTDKNSKLDGLEILQAIIHTTDQDEDTKTIALDLPFYEKLIDRVLSEDDTNNDGFLSYPEYVNGREKISTRYQPSVKIIP